MNYIYEIEIRRRFLIRREIKANEKLVIVQICRSPEKLDDDLPVI